MMSKRSSKKIPAHYGMPDYYKFFCKENPSLNISKKTFNSIISQYNDALCDLLITELTIPLPHRFGKLEIVKELREVYINDEGKVINTNPIDWKATMHLWDNLEEAKEAKVLIRHTNKHTGGYVFRIFYNKRNAVFKNKKIYFFKPVRTLARSITQRLLDYSKPKYDTYVKK